MVRRAILTVGGVVWVIDGVRLTGASLSLWPAPIEPLWLIAWTFFYLGVSLIYTGWNRD